MREQKVNRRGLIWVLRDEARRMEESAERVRLLTDALAQREGIRDVPREPQPDAL